MPQPFVMVVRGWNGFPEEVNTGLRVEGEVEITQRV